jgi:pyruvate-formate lyase-activating enzyme
MSVTSSAGKPAAQDGRWAPPSRLFVEPEALTILGTYKCTAQCQNCCFGSNPFLTQRLDLAEIISFIREGAHYPRCKLVGFSGGECFLLRDDLVRAVEFASSLGLVSRCVTNGYWAKRMEHGRRRLEALLAVGLKELNISTGDFHQKFVDQQTVVNAACLSVELGVDQTMIVVEKRSDREVTAHRLMEDPHIQGLLREHKTRFRIIESPWMPMDYTQLIEQDPIQMLNRNNVHLRTGCRSVLTNVVLTPDRKFGFCCGLTREQIPELNASWDGGSFDDLIDEGSRDFMKIWLSLEGPERILAWAAIKNESISWENRYAHHCHACVALFADPLVRETIRTHYQERVDDVLMRYVAKLRLQQAEAHDFAPVAS